MVTLIGPLVAPDGTVAESEVAFVTVKLPAAIPLNLTAVTPVNPAPVMVTFVPTPPLVGVKLVTVGAATTVKVPLLVAVPPAVVTLSFPVVTPAGATAVIDVALTTV